MMQATTEKTALTAEEVRRLAWRCRRGLLELDIVLQRFSDRYLATLTQVELVALDHLLDLPDNDFLDAVTKRQVPDVLAQESAVVSVLKKMSAE
jgi:antitoxin CptB